MNTPEERFYFEDAPFASHNGDSQNSRSLHRQLRELLSNLQKLYQGKKVYATDRFARQAFSPMVERACIIDAETNGRNELYQEIVNLACLEPDPKDPNLFPGNIKNI